MPARHGEDPWLRADLAGHPQLIFIHMFKKYSNDLDQLCIPIV